MDNTRYDIMGHGLGERSKVAERLVSLCAFNKMIMVCTIFPPKHTHKASRDHATEKLIDRIWINRKFGRSMEDVGKREELI